MAQIETVNIKSDGGYTAINKDEFDSGTHELFIREGEIVVRPLNVEGAKPFIIDERDFDPRSYEKVNASKKNLDLVADQTDRQNLHEAIVEKLGYGVPPPEAQPNTAPVQNAEINAEQITLEKEQGTSPIESLKDGSLPNPDGELGRTMFRESNAIQTRTPAQKAAAGVRGGESTATQAQTTAAAKETATTANSRPPVRQTPQTQLKRNQSKNKSGK